MQKEAVKRVVFEAWRGVSERDEGMVAGRNVTAEARLETARLGRLLQPLARSARRAVRQDKAEWLKRRSARIRAESATGSSRTLRHLVRQVSGSKKARGPKPVAVIAAEDGGEIAARWESIFFQEFSGRGQRVQSKDLESRLQELRIPWQAQLRPEEWLDEDQLAADAGDALGRMRKRKSHGRGLCSHGVLVRGWSRISPGICEAGSAVTPGRGAEANRLHGSSAQKAASATECKECQTRVAGVSHRQDSLDQDSASAPGGCHGQAVLRDQGWFNVGATDRALLFHGEDAQGTDIKAAFYSVFAEIALGGLLPLDTREQLQVPTGPP